MKIAMPVDEKNINANVSSSFGRASYFLFYNTETKETIFEENSAAANRGGAGIAAAQIISDHDAKALLTPRCGENAAEVLRKAEISIYQSISGTAQQNIDAFEAKKLELLDEFHAGFHGHEK